jgi:hypothetical protein
MLTASAALVCITIWVSVAQAAGAAASFHPQPGPTNLQQPTSSGGWHGATTVGATVPATRGCGLESWRRRLKQSQQLALLQAQQQQQQQQLSDVAKVRVVAPRMSSSLLPAQPEPARLLRRAFVGLGWRRASRPQSRSAPPCPIPPPTALPIAPQPDCGALARENPILPCAEPQCAAYFQLRSTPAASNGSAAGAGGAAPGAAAGAASGSGTAAAGAARAQDAREGDGSGAAAAPRPRGGPGGVRQQAVVVGSSSSSGRPALGALRTPARTPLLPATLNVTCTQVLGAAVIRQCRSGVGGSLT